MKTYREPANLRRRANQAWAIMSLTGLLGAGQLVCAVSPSELLQKGIYSEETKGDLEAAMQIYRQVVTEAKNGEAVAAQAQYHLGICCYKKKNYAEANTTFEKLIKDYPDQKELVAMATQYLSGATTLLPAPWVEGEELRMEFKFPAGFKLGTGFYSVRAGEANGAKTWRVSSRMFAGVQSLSRVEVEADSFKPLHSRWKHTLIGDVETVYSPGHANLKTQGKDSVKKIDLTGVVYDNEEVIQMMRRLPLATNYTTTLSCLTSLGGGNIIPVKLEVPGTESVEVPAGTFDCYRVELSIHQTFWYSTDAHRYLVKFEAGGVAAELAAIEQRKAGEPITYRESSFGVSLTAPEDWRFYRSEPDDEKTKVVVNILDPEASATSELIVETLESLKPDQKKSPRSWAESEIANGAKMLKDLKVRPDSWQERTIAGQPAVSFIGDFVEGQEKKIAYGTFMFGNAQAMQVHIMLPAKDFEAFQPKIDGIINSLKLN